MIFTATIQHIKLVSVNAKFLTHPKYINCKEYLRGLFEIEKGNLKMIGAFAGPVSVELYISTSKDIDNNLKLIFDALTDASIWVDDRQIKYLEVHIVDNKKGDRENLFIEVRELKQNMRDYVAQVFKNILQGKNKNGKIKNNNPKN